MNQTEHPLQKRIPTTMTGDVVVKFHFNQRNLIPEGIPFIETLPTEIKDQIHASKETDAAKAAVGRHRQGRVDTGEPVFGRAGLSHVQARFLRQSLHLAGYALVDIHQFVKEYRGKPQYVVAMTFYHNTKMRQKVDLTKVQQYTLNLLAEFTWGSCHVWDNTQAAAQNYTLNFTGLMMDLRPHRRLSIRKGVFVSVDPREED